MAKMITAWLVSKRHYSANDKNLPYDDDTWWKF